MATLTLILTPDRLEAFARTAAKRALDRTSELMDDAPQTVLEDGIAAAVHAALLAVVGIGWKPAS